MKIIKLILFLTIVAGVSSTFAAQCPTTNQIIDPEVLQWIHHPVTANNPEEYFSGVLELGESTFVINGETMTTRAYRQEGGQYTIPGPTMMMEPGKKYVVTFRNLLPYEVPNPKHNISKDPNISNLHTHGLHISGEGVADDVTREIEGGFAGDYVYEILPDHMGGTYWYHAHHHGSTFLQVAGGAMGMIVMDDEFDQIPANVAAMTEKQLAIAYLDPGAKGTGGDTLISGTLSPSWTVNGKINGNVCTQPNTWQHWRVLLADRDAKMKTVSFGNQCEVALMARDGVWRTQAPKILANNSIELTGASRADFAIRCSADSSIMVNGNTVANVYVDGVTGSTVHPFASDGVSSWSAKRPSYLRDLRGVTPSNTETVHMGARTINGNKFDVNVPTFSLNADGVQAWSINGAQNHPFHLHIYHFQVNGACGAFEDGEYYDTIASNCDVRFDLNPQTSTVYQGRTIMHCHILDHEDQGAMGWADVLGGMAPPSYPVNDDLGVVYRLHYPIESAPGLPPSAPSQLAATTASSSQINLTWADNSNNEDNFVVERSLNGIDFTVAATLAANLTSYSDTGLQSATTYTYRLSAVNAADSSAFSNLASATTDQAGQASSIQVGSISLSTNSVGGGQKQGVATVVILDDLGNPVQDAFVSGEFTGDINEQVINGLPTDASGTTTITSSGTAKGKLTLSFCVTNVSHNTLQGFTAPPGAVCGTL